MSTITNEPILLDETGRRMATALELMAQHMISQGGEATSWSGVQSLIRQGWGPQVYPVGSQLAVEHTVYGTIVFDVIGHDIDPDPRGLLEHSMTLQMHDCLKDNTQIDGIEAMYYAESGLPAGTYNFTLLAGYDVDYGGGKTYQFALTKDVPAGGVITYSWPYQQQAAVCKVNSYPSVTSTAAIETVGVAEGADGTALGVCDGKTANLNHTHRLRYGSNNYKQSAIRQWLNSAAAANAWWASQTIYDRPPNYTSRPGFLAGLPADFVDAVGETEHIVALNTLTDGGGSEIVRDKFFLLSRAEVYGDRENNISEGQRYPYWAGATNTDRIKLLNGAPRYWWLRSPDSGGASNVRNVSPVGALGSTIASGTYGVAAACTIY